LFLSEIRVVKLCSYMTNTELDDERTRAEDIILGSLGYGENARILEVQYNETGTGYVGKGVWPDGEEFSFASEEKLEALEYWALKILKVKRSGKKGVS
jgi:hypothetical protein